MFLIKNKGYFITKDEASELKCMVLKSSWRNKFQKVLIKKNILALRLSFSAGWRESDISFVSGLPLKSLEVYNWDVKDISPIASLKELEYLGLECNYRKFDFSVLSNLKNCFMRYRPGSETIFSIMSLNEINMISYPFEDISPISHLKNLKTLKIQSRKLKSLKGIEELAQLEHLDLFECTQLTDIHSLVDAAKIRKLEIETCKKISDITPIGNLKDLEYLKLDNCGNINSLLPLKSCERLSTLFFVLTYIVDGKVSFLKDLNLQNVAFGNRRHYDCKREDVYACTIVRNPRNTWFG